VETAPLAACRFDARIATPTLFIINHESRSQNGTERSHTMLAHLIDEQHPTCEPVSLDPTLAPPPTDDQEAFAEAAYEAALQLDAEVWWPCLRPSCPEDRILSSQRCKTAARV
jgi:hypothetical protein